LLIDAKTIEAAAKDPRTLALADTSKTRLALLGFPQNAVPMQHIHVSEYGRFGRVVMSAQDLQRPALGWTVRYGDLVTCLHEAVLKTGITCWRGVALQSSVEQTDHIELTLSDGKSISSVLQVDAEGGLFGQAHARDTVRDYQQWALVATVSAQTYQSQSESNAVKRRAVAYERFTPDGPLAFLPTAVDGSRYAMVWCASPELTEQRKATDPAELLKQVSALMGGRLPLNGLQDLASFPLGLNMKTLLVQGRRVCVGNAAQILHPVAGQGLNLGLRDADALAQCLSPSQMASFDALSAALDAFEQSRKADRQVLVTLTDWMARGFANRNPVISAGRQLALLGLEFLPGAKRFFAETMLFGWVR
jgi:2-octaprenyl-6-methoxyphenol hydroxylase